MEAGGLKKVQVGVQLVADQECPWLSQLPPEVRSNMPNSTPDNRRRFQRHQISFPLEFRDERVNTPMRVNATDISGNGCYVETVMPLAISTVLRVDFWIDQEHISASATVRTRDPGVGMGIEFTGLPEDTKKRFQAHLDKLDPGLSMPRPKSRRISPPHSQITFARTNLPGSPVESASSVVSSHRIQRLSKGRSRRNEDWDHVLPHLRRQRRGGHRTRSGTGPARPRDSFHFLCPAHPAARRRT